MNSPDGRSTIRLTLGAGASSAPSCCPARRRRYNDHVRDVATLTGVTLCDVEHSFAHLDPRELAEMLHPYPDHLHLSPRGHQLYASAIQPHIERAVADIAAR